MCSAPKQCVRLSCLPVNIVKMLTKTPVRAGSHGVILSKCVKANLKFLWFFDSGYFVGN